MASTRDPGVVNPTVKDLASQLIRIPALYSVIQHECKTGKLGLDTLGISTWLYVRATSVLAMLQKYGHPSIEIEPESLESEEKWQLVSTSLNLCISTFSICAFCAYRPAAVMGYRRLDTARSIPI